MREEYTRENYPSFGKKYNGEKAIISLTSWRARINTVSKTLFSLLKQCPGFHIVLVLSEEEFPKMMDELPDNLRVFAENELIEILWVKENLRPHKKYFYTMQKYKKLPIILADDDLIYKSNIAEILYKKWNENKTSIIASRCHLVTYKNKIPQCYRNWLYETKTYCDKHLFFTTGAGTLFPPNCFNLNEKNLVEIENCITADDVYLNALANRLNIKKINLHCFKFVEQNDNTSKSFALCKLNVLKSFNDKYLKHFIKDFL